MEALVFAGGEPLHARWLVALPTDALVVAADSGLERAHAIGRRVDLVVGDMDSVDAAALRHAVEAGSAVEAHPFDKDATDLELAIDAAFRRGANPITVLSAGGGRLDHFLANIVLLASPRWARVEMRAYVDEAIVAVVRGARDPAMLRGQPGSLVTLIPVGGPASGVHTTGLRWSLTGDDLSPGSSRGVSNEMTEHTATVSLAGGALLAVQPHGGALP